MNVPSIPFSELMVSQRDDKKRKKGCLSKLKYGVDKVSHDVLTHHYVFLDTQLQCLAIF